MRVKIRRVTGSKKSVYLCGASRGHARRGNGPKLYSDELLRVALGKSFRDAIR